ncbi:histone-lysine N-methyltransferase SETMAR-like, partial [Odontomachus brunneus]|uniref:histone-lysine N-methyltransferase SETMAR-like n=1 Tax=Odontomachus brunneus TaxID=486640 RepID=UPI0013F232BF
FDVKDESCSGRPITEKSDKIMEKVKRDKHVSSVEIARKLGIDHKTVLNHLHKAGYKKKLDVWVPHVLNVKNMMDQINICNALLKRNEIELFLKRMITGDEKWVTYDNRTRKRSCTKKREKAQAIAKPRLTTKKNSLNGAKLASKKACENHLKQFFDQKPQKFYRDGIVALP